MRGRDGRPTPDPSVSSLSRVSLLRYASPLSSEGATKRLLRRRCPSDGCLLLLMPMLLGGSLPARVAVSQDEHHFPERWTGSLYGKEPRVAALVSTVRGVETFETAGRKRRGSRCLPRLFFAPFCFVVELQSEIRREGEGRGDCKKGEKKEPFLDRRNHCHTSSVLRTVYSAFSSTFSIFICSRLRLIPFSSFLFLHRITS